MGLISKYKEYKIKFLEENRDLIKPEDYSKGLFIKFCRVVSIFISKPLYKYTKITANQVTLFITLLSFLMAYLFYLGEYKYVLIAGILLLIQEIFDHVDGVIARLRETASKIGTWYDILSDWIRLDIVYFGMTWGVYRMTNDWRVWIFGFLTVSSYMYSMAMNRKVYVLFPEFARKLMENEKKKRKFIKNFFYDGPFINVAIFLAAIVNLIYPILIFLGLYGWFYCLVAFIMLTKRIKYYRKEDSKSD